MTDFTKPVQTHSGLPVTIITTEGRGEFQVIGYIGDSVGVSIWYKSGKYYSNADGDLDLINVPEKRVIYMNGYSNRTMYGPFHSRTHADICDKDGLSGDRTECIRVEYTEGQFDE